MNVHSAETVTIGIPVYRGARFLEETLHSVQQQTHRDFEAVISLDGPHPAEADLCLPFLADARFKLVTQPERLGWVRNLEWLMARVRTPFWCYQQQDDLWDPLYLETLLAAARGAPEAAVLYCDIAAFGDLDATFVMSSVTGSAPARQLALMCDRHPAVAFRGLTRAEVLRTAGGIPPNEVDDFACETVWMSAAARCGELQRVPGNLYRKRFHDANEHAKRTRWPLEKRTRAWIAHCVAMLRQAMLVDASPQQRRLLWLGSVSRLATFPDAVAYLGTSSWTREQRIALLETYLAHLRGAPDTDVPAWLRASWEALESWTRAFFWAD